MAEPEHLVDPAVSRAKFAWEIDVFIERRWEHHAKGWWLIEADFPKVFIVMTVPQLIPPSILCGVEFDFLNYDFWPPSVRLIHPFTRQPYTLQEAPTPLLRLAKTAEGHQQQSLLVAHSKDDIPFICVPGTREYHQHPAHTGDSWLQHRGGGEGSLHHLLSMLYQYGVEPIKSYSIDMRVNYNLVLTPE